MHVNCLEENHMNKDAPSQKLFSVSFVVGPQIQTQIKSKNISPQEMIGLLEMAKDQILGKLRGTTQNMLDIQKRDDE